MLDNRLCKPRSWDVARPAFTGRNDRVVGISAGEGAAVCAGNIVKYL